MLEPFEVEEIEFLEATIKLKTHIKREGFH
jgi:hypothetical protein